MSTTRQLSNLQRKTMELDKVIRAIPNIPDDIRTRLINANAFSAHISGLVRVHEASNDRAVEAQFVHSFNNLNINYTDTLQVLEDTIAVKSYNNQ